MNPRKPRRSTTLFTVRRVGNSPALVPASHEALEQLHRLGDGATVVAKVNEVRDGRTLRKFFAMIKAVHDMLPNGKGQLGAIYPTHERLRAALIVAAGYHELFTTLDGEIQLHPMSIAYENMDEATFRALYKACMLAVVNDLCVHIDDRELAIAIEERVLEFAPPW